MPSGVYDRKKVKKVPKSQDALSKKLGEGAEAEPNKNEKDSQLTDLQTRLNARQILPEESEKETPYQKRKREKAELEQQSIGTIKGGLSLATDLLLEVGCARLPNPLPPTDTEKKIFNQSIEAGVDKYLPMILPYAVEVSILLSVLVIAVPRLKKNDTPKAKDNTDIREDGNREKQIGKDSIEQIPASVNS